MNIVNDPTGANNPAAAGDRMIAPVFLHWCW
jgi:hypothetical protein